MNDRHRNFDSEAESTHVTYLNDILYYTFLYLSWMSSWTLLPPMPGEDVVCDIGV